MSAIVFPILMIIVPLSTERSTIRVHEDISRTAHIPIETLHHRWLLILSGVFIFTDEKLHIRSIYDRESPARYPLFEPPFRRTHEDTLCDAEFSEYLKNPGTIARTEMEMGRIPCLIEFIEESPRDRILDHPTPDSKSDRSSRGLEGIRRVEEKYDIRHSWLDISEITLIKEYPLNFLHRKRGGIDYLEFSFFRASFSSVSEIFDSHDDHRPSPSWTSRSVIGDHRG